jgi:histidinol phosphatase-like PHP family hydrolase
VSPHGFGGAAEAGGHADFDATYRYTCGMPDQLDHLDVRLASAFPAVQKIVVNLITAAGSNQQTLDGTTTRVDIQQ